MPHLAPATGVHGGHCTGWHPDAEANHAGKRDCPLVHSCLSRPHLTCVCRIGLVLSIPEVEEEGPDLEEEEGRSLRVDEEGLSLRVFEEASTRGLDLAEEESLGRLGMVEHDGDELKIKKYKKKAE